MTSMANRAASAALWSALEIASRYGVQFVVTAVLARILTPTDFGLVALVLIFTSLGSALVESGFGTALIQHQNPSDDDQATVFIYALGVSLVMVIFLLVGAPWISNFFQEPRLIDLLRVSALVLPLSAVATVPDAMLTMKLRFRERTVAQLAASLFSGLIGVVLALKGFGTWSLVWQMLTGAFVRSVALLVTSRWAPRGRFSAASYGRLARFGSYMLLSAIIDTLLIRLQSVLLGRMTDVRSLGYYTVAQSAQQAPALFIGSVLNRVGLPVFSQLIGDRTRLSDAVSAALRVSMFVFVPCMIAIALLAKQLVQWVYGPAWDAAAPILSILALGTALWPMHVLNLAAISALGRADLFFRLELAKAGSSVVLVIFAAPFGAFAIACAATLASLVAAVINTWYSRALFGHGLKDQLRGQLATVGLTVLSGCTGSLLAHALGHTFLATFASFSIAVGIYIVTAEVLNLQVWREVKSVLRRTLSGHDRDPGQ